MYPANYTFVGNEVLNCDSIITSACTTDTTYTTCPHPSTLTDSDIGSETEVDRDYFEWDSKTAFEILFTFSSEVSLTSITLSYFYGLGKGTIYGLPDLRFFALPDDYEFGSNLTSGSILLHVGSITKFLPGSRTTENFKIPRPMTTKKLVLERNSQGYRCAFSEIKFFANCKVGGSLYSVHLSTLKL